MPLLRTSLRLFGCRKTCLPLPSTGAAGTASRVRTTAVSVHVAAPPGGTEGQRGASAPLRTCSSRHTRWVVKSL